MQYEPECFSSPAYLAAIDSQSRVTATKLPQDVMNAIHTHAAKGYPHEICGLLIGKLLANNWQIDKAIAVPNINTDRAADRFQLDPEIYRQIEAKLRGTDTEIIGVYHSHPDCPAKPSPTDVQYAWDGWCYAIISVQNKQVVDTSFWVLNDAGTAFATSITEIY